MTTRLLHTTAAALALLLTACGGSDDKAAPPPRKDPPGVISFPAGSPDLDSLQIVAVEAASARPWPAASPPSWPTSARRCAPGRRWPASMRPTSPRPAPT